MNVPAVARSRSLAALRRLGAFLSGWLAYLFADSLPDRLSERIARRLHLRRRRWLSLTMQSLIYLVLLTPMALVVGVTVSRLIVAGHRFLALF